MNMVGGDMMSGLLLLLAIGLWFWFDSLSALELARNAGRKACIKENLQFLDDTVERIGLSLVRDDSGRRVMRRTYRFEFSETGNSRREGQLILTGKRIESLTLEPYQTWDEPGQILDEQGHVLNEQEVNRLP